MAGKTQTRTVSDATSKRHTKKDRLIKLLRRNEGASIDEMTMTTGWLPHTARAMLTGLRKKGFVLEKNKVDGATRYTIGSEPAA